jgi:hypothetical protein
LLTPERLEQLLARLNDVMAEATRLRRHVTRQMNDQRRTSQQKLTSKRKRPSKHR